MSDQNVALIYNQVNQQMQIKSRHQRVWWRFTLSTTIDTAGGISRSLGFAWNRRTYININVRRTP